MAFGIADMLLVLFMTGDGGDLARILPAQPYYQSRGIEINIDKAAELAAKDPVDGKAQIAQLVALRYLADESAKLKASPKYEQHRQLLAGIAQGKQAQDPQGFAKEYAAVVLAKLDDKKLPASAAPSLRDDAFRWFPANANLLSALDIRLARGDRFPKAHRAETLKAYPADILNAVYDAIEKTGNVRIDRIAFANVGSPKGQGAGEPYIRLTGKVNPIWLVKMLKDLKFQPETETGPNGEAITTLIGGQVMLIGETDLLIANSPTIFAAPLLEFRSGKKRHAGEGDLQSELAKIPAQACGLVVGKIPREAAQGAPFLVPVMISGHISRVDNSLDVQLAGRMANDDDARQLVKQVSQFRMQGVAELKKLQGTPLPIPGFQAAQLIQVLERMRVESEGSTAKLRMLLPDDVLSMLLGFGAGAIAPPPKVEK